jgi:tRNA A-37 threonylcarbamoyl transferase component Bud32
LHNDRLLFLAIEDGSHQQLLVKFTRRYATEVHELLASARHVLAPQLFACEDLPGGWKMAVIEFLPQEQWLTLDVFLRKNPGANTEAAVRDQLGEALNILRCGGFVHGDIRPYNILVSTLGADINVRLIDFDYSGEAEKDRYPRDWNYLVRPKVRSEAL